MKAVLISTYELGRQPFGLASPAAWLRARQIEVVCLDLSVEPLREDSVRDAGLIAFYVPMHTATRLAIEVLAIVRGVNPLAHLCFYGLYAPVNEMHLRGLGVHTILGGEFEASLADLAARLASGQTAEAFEAPVISRARLKFQQPDRRGLAPLDRYARLRMPNGEERVVGYTEASRGCKHMCRHCPIVPVYDGVFRIVDREIVLEDIRRQVAVGAQHITFGDPDFFNGIGHALPLIESLHRQFPGLTYDVTIKIEHLLKHADHLPSLRDTGCLFVTSAVESIDNSILRRLDKGHTRADFLQVVDRFRQAGLILQPTFIPFTPWTTVEGYCDLLVLVREAQLIENVAPVQLSIRLLIPDGSRLLGLPEIREMTVSFDQAGLVYPWKHKDARLDDLYHQVQGIVQAGERVGHSRETIFDEIEKAANQAAGLTLLQVALSSIKSPAVPHLSEPWYCCSEPSSDQLTAIKQIGDIAGPQESCF